MLTRALDPERIESVKAGMIAALIGSAVTALFVGVDSLIASLVNGLPVGTPAIFTPALVPQAIRRLVIGAVCCFLFGVTYRYIIRQDSNPHLRSGAVGAFALTRSLSQLESIELSELTLANILPLGITITESFGLFLSVRLVLDLGLRQQWLKPFLVDSEP